MIGVCTVLMEGSLKTIKVFINESGNKAERKLVDAEFLEDRGPTILVRLPDGRSIVRKKKRDLFKPVLERV